MTEIRRTLQEEFAWTHGYTDVWPKPRNGPLNDDAPEPWDFDNAPEEVPHYRLRYHERYIHKAE